MTESIIHYTLSSKNKTPISSIINSQGEKIDLSKYKIISDNHGDAIADVLFNVLKRLEAIEKKLGIE